MDPNRMWEAFDFDYSFNPQDIFADLISVEGYKQAALSLVLPPEWRNQLDRLNRIRAVYGTTALEGNPLSEAEVEHQIDLVDQEQEARDDTRVPRVSIEQLQIRNAARAQAWVKTRFLPGAPPVSLGDILLMHKMVTQRSDEEHNTPGELRSFPVIVGSSDMGGVHRCAPHEDLGALMEGFVEFLNSNRLQSQHPVIRALLAHFFLVTIHPFGDGNGRVSRLLEAGILFQSEYNVHGFYGLSNYFYGNETEYKTSLQQSRQRLPFDVAPFVKFGVRGFVSELAGINNFIKTKINRVVYRQMILQNYQKRLGVRRRILNLREYNLLTFLLAATEPLDPFSETPSRQITLAELQGSQYIEAAYRDVTRRTFYRELVRLAGAGFIRFEEGKSATGPIVELDFGAIARYQIT